MIGRLDVLEKAKTVDIVNIESVSVSPRSKRQKQSVQTPLMQEQYEEVSDEEVRPYETPEEEEGYGPVLYDEFGNHQEEEYDNYEETQEESKIMKWQEKIQVIKEML